MSVPTKVLICSHGSGEVEEVKTDKVSVPTKVLICSHDTFSKDYERACFGVSSY